MPPSVSRVRCRPAGRCRLAQAQDRVTVVQRDGGKVSGVFEDWHRPSDIVYCGCRPPTSGASLTNVLVMDFGGDAASLAPAETGAAQERPRPGDEGRRGAARAAAQHRGRRGLGKPDEPRLLSFQAGAERRFRMTEVARLYLGNYPKVTAAAPEATVDVPPGALRVPANQQWTQTSITVRRGDRLQFSVTGEIQLSTDASDKAISAGSLTGATRRARRPAVAGRRAHRAHRRRRAVPDRQPDRAADHVRERHALARGE